MDFELFPAPRPERTSLAPAMWPGVDPESAETVANILKDQHEKWHCYFNRENRYHNHSSHHTLALWALGANKAALNQAYTRDSVYQTAAFDSPGEITKSNWKGHLGDDNYYQAYVNFFTEVVQERGVILAIEEYIFSFSSNFSHDGKQPAMLSRFLAGLYHSMILVGYGVEFNIPGLVIEGLAQTAVHENDSEALLTPVFFQRCLNDIAGPIPLTQAISGTDRASEIFYTLASRISSHLEKFNLSTPNKPKAECHTLSIVARMSKDKRFDGYKQQELLKMYSDLMSKFSEPIMEYAGQWSLDMHLGGAARNKKELEDKLEELAWTYTVLYGLSGWKEGQPFNADFLIAHCVTSALFLFSIAPKLQVSSQILLIRAHFAVTLAWWIGRGRAKFDIPGFAEAKAKELGSANATTATNPWLPIVQLAIAHPEDHVSKLQRALAHWEQLYGFKGPNDPRLSATELTGADKLDGSLFLRTAKLTADRTEKRPDVEGKFAFDWAWDIRGYYDNA
ncbi:hypothetical protein AX15_007318 [Amanita polypyramis BW_CC]|nr:hypothetical protein AX15_007318 [Amanita polypyramis BW_CC]